MLKRIGIIGFFKTLYWNLKLLPFSQAICLPILFSRYVSVYKTRFGSVQFNDKIGFGMLSFGVSYWNFSFKERIFIQIEGKLVINGCNTHYFAGGTSMTIRKNGILEIGDKFSAGRNCRFMISAHSLIGDNIMFSWDNQYMDSDAHPIYNSEGQILNEPKGFVIEDNVWMGCRCTTLKGVRIKEGCIIAANSLMTKSTEWNNSLYAGDRCLKRDIKWKRSVI